MIAGPVYKGRTMKRVTVHDITVDEGETPDDTESRILDTALVAARETRSSLFGWGIEWNGGDVAVVTLHTD